MVSTLLLSCRESVVQRRTLFGLPTRTSLHSEFRPGRKRALTRSPNPNPNPRSPPLRRSRPRQTQNGTTGSHRRSSPDRISQKQNRTLNDKEETDVLDPLQPLRRRVFPSLLWYSLERPRSKPPSGVPCNSGSRCRRTWDPISFPV